MIIIKTLTEDFILDADNFSIPENQEWVTLDATRLYQSLTQVSPQGKVGFTFLRMDNGFLPMKENVLLNVKNIVYFGKGEDNSEFGRIFKEFITSEAARKAGIVVPK